MWPASWRRLRSFQAGLPMLLKSAGPSGFQSRTGFPEYASQRHVIRLPLLNDQ